MTTIIIHEIENVEIYRNQIAFWLLAMHGYFTLKRSTELNAIRNGALRHSVRNLISIHKKEEHMMMWT